MQPIDEINYKNCKILIHIDECAENPLTDCDGMPPIYCHGAERFSRGETYGDFPDICKLAWAIPCSHFERGQRIKTLEYFGLLECFRDHQKNGWATQAELKYWLADQLRELYNAASLSDRLELMESICNLLEWPCYSTQINGYSQGQCWHVMAIATPDFLRTTGIEMGNALRDLECSVECYGSWLVGDCYGYTLEDSEGNEIDGSCWGFIGDDHEKSGLLGYARSNIDSHLKGQDELVETLEAAFSL